MARSARRRATRRSARPTCSGRVCRPGRARPRGSPREGRGPPGPRAREPDGDAKWSPQRSSTSASRRSSPPRPRREATRNRPPWGATDPGTVVGTVGYMSPEQVRGEAVDHRSDIFSLGCVLHEMLSGRRAFARGTVAETMTAILREDATALSESGRAVPPALERIVAHCLEKKPEQRFQSASDLAFRFSESVRRVRGRCRRVGGSAPRGGWRWLAGGLAALVVAAVGYGVGRGAAAPEAMQPVGVRFMQVTDLPGRGVQAQSLARRQDGRFREPAGRRRRRVCTTGRRPQPDQPHAGLREGRHRAGVRSGRRADRVPLRMRRRGRLRDGRDWRVTS